MASNDEYQQQQFWDQGQGWMDLICSVVANRMNQELEKQFSESHDNVMKHISAIIAPLDNVAWTKTGQGWEFKTK